MKIKLLQTCQIPDETWKQSRDHPVQPVATNYAGAVLEVSEELAAKLIEERKAVSMEPELVKPEPAAPRSALESRVTRTLDGPTSEK